MHWAKAMPFALFVFSALALPVAILEHRAIDIAACANAAANLNDLVTLLAGVEFPNTDEV
jgi:hypothetical protein